MDARVVEDNIGLWTGERDLTQDFRMTESGEDVMKILCYAARSGCQDVIFQTGAPILMNKLGSLIALTAWTYDTTDFMRAAKHISGSGGDVETRLAGAGRSISALMLAISVTVTNTASQGCTGSGRTSRRVPMELRSVDRWSFVIFQSILQQ